jgi:hypothetical protein
VESPKGSTFAKIDNDSTAKTPSKHEGHNPLGALRRSPSKFRGDLKKLNIRVDSLKENLRDFQFPSRPKFTLSVVEWPLCGEIDLFAVASIMGQLYPSSLSEKNW